MSDTSFVFSEDQLQIASHFRQLINAELDMSEVRKVFEGTDAFHQGVWRAMSENGWLGLITPEKFGGAGLNMIDLCQIGIELGKSLAPVPYFSHVCLATQALVRHGSDDNGNAYLNDLATGQTLATFGFREEGESDWRTSPAVRVVDGRISGSKVVVPYGACADIAVISAIDDSCGEADLYIVDLSSAGVHATVSDTLDPASSYARLDFDDAPVKQLGRQAIGQNAINDLIYNAAVVFGFVQLGGAEAAFDMAKHYALERYAFGRKIASFQAIKHKLGRMFEALFIAKSNCQFGAWALKHHSDLIGLASASALTASCDAFNQCARDNNKIHGGISATWDFDCHLFYRRARLNALVMGNQQCWSRIIAENLRSNRTHLNTDFGEKNDTELETIRRSCRQWIADNAPDVKELYHYRDDQRFEVILNWHKRKAAAGWACLHWPEQYGGKGWSPERIAIWRQEEGEALRDLCFPLSIVDIAGAVLMAVGTESQKTRYLPKIYSGDEYWCQLFSEPHGGSDVGALRTRAVKDGDDWIVNGQKIWTSNANYSDFGLLIARTDPTVAKHKGLTYFIMDMHAEGVTTRPLKQSTGDAGFCEVFFDNVRISDSNRLGEVGDGWKIVMMTLANEKVALQLFQIYIEKFLDAIEGLKVDGMDPLEQPQVQSRLKDFNNRAWAIKFGELESMHNLLSSGQPGHEESVSKLIVAATNLDIASFVIELFDDQCFDSDTLKKEELKFFEYIYIHFVGVSMGGGTEEILLNLIGEQYLRLPPEPRVDKDVPFDQLPYGA
jgi:alkylation response protein AidB-like acyl-CoA dehydrogenase